MDKLGKEMADCFDKVINPPDNTIEVFGCKKGKNHCVSGFGDCENQSVYMGICIYYEPQQIIGPREKCKGKPKQE